MHHLVRCIDSHRGRGPRGRQLLPCAGLRSHRLCLVNGSVNLFPSTRPSALHSEFRSRRTSHHDRNSRSHKPSVPSSPLGLKHTSQFSPTDRIGQALGLGWSGRSGVGRVSPQPATTPVGDSAVVDSGTPTSPHQPFLRQGVGWSQGSSGPLDSASGLRLSQGESGPFPVLTSNH